MKITSIEFTVQLRDKSPEDLVVEQLLKLWYQPGDKRPLKYLTTNQESEDGLIKKSVVYRIDDIQTNTPNTAQQNITFILTEESEEFIATTC